MPKRSDQQWRNIRKQISKKAAKDSDWLVYDRDTRGSTRTFSFNIPPAIYQQLHTVVQSRRFPVDSPQHLARVALVVFLDVLDTLEPIKGSIMGQALLAVEACKREMNDFYCHQAFTQLETLVLTFLQAGHKEPVSEKLVEMGEYVERMPEGYWKRVALDRLAQIEDYAFGVMRGERDLPPPVAGEVVQMPIGPVKQYRKEQKRKKR